MRRLIMLSLAALLSASTVTGTAHAITDGALDGDAHPYVGIMVAKDKAGAPLWRCSGTLLSPTLYLTAGHCTEDPAASAELWFASDLRTLTNSGYPTKGEVSGKTYVHPSFNPAAFSTRDLGVVVLSTPVKLPSYGVLPARDSLDALTPSASTSFTSVGYGLQKAFPEAADWKTRADKVRMVATPHLLQINGGTVGDYAMLLSDNASTGGTCFGDSGGPNFLGSSNVVAGVTSFAMNSTCGGTSGVFRVDTGYAQDWLATFTTTKRR